MDCYSILMKDSQNNTTLEEQLRDIEAAKEEIYDKRTEHLNKDGSAIFINRLIREDSPYLLQHAHNPVNWYPWGTEAFETAKKENKPIFLSIGYSTCHWCHVMEVESFDNVDIAKVLNENFISIKMDREQYPDIDEAYMTGVQLMSGHGGWPMSNFLLSDGKPFFGATYFPPPTFMKLLSQIIEAWRGKYSELESSAAKIGEAIDRVLGERKKAVNFDLETYQHVTQALLHREDRSLGGLAGAPKFPQEPLILFMLDRANRQRHVPAMEFAKRSMEAMARGGIYDQVAGGFHRYSVDAQWLVPHFEKMLYNQSQLSLAYLWSCKLTGSVFFRRVCFQILEYVLRDMQLPEGGFYSATDADSEGAEGIFFLWSIDSIKEVLTKSESNLAIGVFGITEQGNFEGLNILRFSKSYAELEAEYGRNFTDDLDKILHKLYLSREQRIHPIRDEKLIVGWTAAMATSFALAGDYFQQKHWILAAKRAVELILENNLDEKGNLKRIYLNGMTSIEGQLEDYANLIEALITLFDVTAMTKYLVKADAIMTACLERYWDNKESGFFLSPADQLGPQLTRSCSASDGATLAPAATALCCLVSLRDRSAFLRAEASQFYGERVDQCASSVIGELKDNEMSHTSILRQLSVIREGSRSLIQYVNSGLARIKIEQTSGDDLQQKKVSIVISVFEGWHLTAAGVEFEQYKPLSVSLAEGEKYWLIEEIQYPENHNSLAELDDERILTYDGELQLSVLLQRSKYPSDGLTFSAELQVELQLCNDRNCLLPSLISFRI
ncbi:MAG: thioredoxin [Gammaproteobacteria bacterium]|nr:thioredoxin [Gammaproteobacteria bacterium]